jgi:hypothetical protein
MHTHQNKNREGFVYKRSTELLEIGNISSIPDKLIQRQAKKNEYS